MADQTFNCSLVTPDHELFDEPVSYVSFPAWDGQVGIQHGRAPLLCKLGVGSMRLDFPSGAHKMFMIEGGFAQMVHNRLTILSDNAQTIEELSVAEAEQELTQAQALPGVSDAEFAAKSNALQAARAKRRLAQNAARR